jgi:Fe-S cluster biosynthesis and repair protein YggX
MNNTLPLSSLRNEIGKVLTPYTRELGSDIESSIRNRNLISENVAFDPLPIKYDILTGKPIKDHNFMTRMFNAVSPVNFNLDYSPGRELLFNSGYDLRTSSYAAPDGTDLSDSPKVRSMYQKAIGEQNLLKQFDDLANSESIQASLAEMQYEKRSGNKSTEPRSFPHYKRIAKIFDRAKKRAWAKIKKENDVQKLLIEERNQKVQNRSANQRTIDKILDINK